MNAAPPLFGLVLTGGKSTRMGSDKALLRYDGETQLDRAMRLVTPRVVRAFVSVRRTQAGDSARARYAQIVDAPLAGGADEAFGPIAGIMAAQQAHPDAAWLVLACDLPYLDDATLGHLIASRDPRRAATVYASTRDGLPEPLCAIYEPGSAAALAAHVASGRRCPRKFLLDANTLLLTQPEPEALANVNTEEEFRTASARVRGDAPGALTAGAGAAAPLQTLKVQYYAVLREQAGVREEQVTSRAPTAQELFTELAARHGFKLAPSALKVAVNAEFSSWSRPLRDGDTVVFIPPVAGG